MFELKQCKDGVCEITIPNLAYPVGRKFRDCNEANQSLIYANIEKLFELHPDLKMKKWVIDFLYNADDINNICNQIMYGFRLSELVGDATMADKSMKAEGDFTRVVVVLDCERV